jgi:hypothetical protein
MLEEILQAALVFTVIQEMHRKFTALPVKNSSLNIQQVQEWFISQLSYKDMVVYIDGSKLLDGANNMIPDCLATTIKTAPHLLNPLVVSVVQIT